MADKNIFRKFGDLKVCSKCGEAKSRSNFNKERGRERAYCKICHGASVREWVLKNREKRRAYFRKWTASNRERTRGYSRKAYQKDRLCPEKLAKKAAYKKRRHLERKYGLTQIQWDEMFRAQGGVCALCQIPGRTGRHGKLSVDHCHETGRVRGLLCTPCNVSIGILGETTERIERLLKYMGGDTAMKTRNRKRRMGPVRRTRNPVRRAFDVPPWDDEDDEDDEREVELGGGIDKADDN